MTRTVGSSVQQWLYEIRGGPIPYESGTVVSRDIQAVSWSPRADLAQMPAVGITAPPRTTQPIAIGDRGHRRERRNVDLETASVTSDVSNWRCGLLDDCASESEEESPSEDDSSGFESKRNFFEHLSSPPHDEPILRRHNSSYAIRNDQNKAKTCVFPQPEPKKQVTVVKEGPIDRVKLIPPGKKLPKHWKPKYLILTNQALFFAENSDVLLTMKSGNPGLTENVDLQGAHVTHHSPFTSKKNVIHVVTNKGYIALVQNDNNDKDDGWYNAILSIVNNLYTSMPRTRSLKDISDEDVFIDQLGRDLKLNLKRLITRRPTMESLVDKGIYRDEPIFGNYLDQLYKATKMFVPEFVEKSIEILEMPEHVVSDGIYRTSGNMSHIQSLRIKVDQGHIDALETQKDTDVLAGALKLFFRELKAPLIPYSLFKDLLNILTSQQEEEQIFKAVKSEIKQKLSPSHLRTLEVLCKHFLRVTAFESQNKMDIKNLAIVWGPTMTWSDDQNLFQCIDINRVIEYLISHTSVLFKT